MACGVPNGLPVPSEPTDVEAMCHSPFTGLDLLSETALNYVRSARDKGTVSMARHDTCPLIFAGHASLFVAYPASAPHTCRAVARITSNFRHWSSSVNRFPAILEAKPHWGLRASCSSGR